MLKLAASNLMNLFFIIIMIIIIDYIDVMYLQRQLHC